MYATTSVSVGIAYLNEIRVSVRYGTYESQNTYLYAITFFFFTENHVVYEIMWRNVVQP